MRTHKIFPCTRCARPCETYPYAKDRTEDEVVGFPELEYPRSGYCVRCTSGFTVGSPTAILDLPEEPVDEAAELEIVVEIIWLPNIRPPEDLKGTA